MSHVRLPNFPWLMSLVLGVAVVLGLLSDLRTANAQVERQGGGASAALMAQYQQLLTERAQLQTDNAKLKQRLEDEQMQLAATRRQISTLQSGSSAMQTQLQQAQAASQTYEKSFADTRTRLQELLDRYRQTVTTMQGIELSRNQLQQQLTESKAAFDECAKRNVELYQVDDEVLDRYEHQGMFSYLERSDPFTRLKRTQIENLVDDYLQRAQGLRQPVSPGAAAGTGAGAAQSAPPKP